MLNAPTRTLSAPSLSTETIHYMKLIDLITFAQDLQASTAMEYNGHGLEKKEKNSYRMIQYYMGNSCHCQTVTYITSEIMMYSKVMTFVHY